MRVPVSAVTLLIGAVALLAQLHCHRQGEGPTSFLDLEVIRNDAPDVPLTRGIAAVAEAVAEALEVRAEDSIKDVRLAKVGADEKLSRVAWGGGLAPGQEVTVAFDVERDGFVSIWSLDADRKPSRVLPNRFGTTEANGVPVRAGVRYRAGGGGLFEGGDKAPARKAWTLRITEPHGPAEVFVRWSAHEQWQLPEGAFGGLRDFGKSLEEATRDSPPSDRHNLVHRYEVVQAP